MSHAWSFVIASYGVALLCIVCLTGHALYRYRQASRRLAQRDRSSSHPPSCAP